MGYVLVQWSEQGKRRVKAWPRTPAGKTDATAWAQGFAERRGQPAPAAKVTLREMWTRYADVEFPHLRRRTHQLYTEHWNRWELFNGRDTIAEDTRRESMDRFVATLTTLKLAVTHQQRIVRDIKTVYAWAESRELISRNRLAGYRLKAAKEARRERPAEYRRGDVEKILAQLSPQKRTEWRAWAALTLAAFQGARERAILHLTWRDVDLERGRLTWRAAYDKQGREWTQPLTLAGYSALLTARWWREQDGELRPWVFPSPQERKRCGREEPGVYGAQALWLALRGAEQRAGVPRLPFRAVHGFRRGVAGDVARASGDPWLGVQYIGDTGTDRIAEYVQERTDTLEGAAAALDRMWTESVKLPSTPSNGQNAK
jgi:integrase